MMPKSEQHKQPPLPREWDQLSVNEHAGASRFSVHVRPRSSRCAILGVREGVLDVALTSPPAEGAANEELVKLLARALEVRRSDVSIVVGMSSRKKLIEVRGTSADSTRELLRKTRL